MLLRFTFIISRFQSSFSVFYFTFCFFFPSYSVSPFSESSSTIYPSPVRAVASVLFPIWSRIQSMRGASLLYFLTLLVLLISSPPGLTSSPTYYQQLLFPPQRTPFSTTFPLLFSSLFFSFCFFFLFVRLLFWYLPFSCLNHYQLSLPVCSVAFQLNWTKGGWGYMARISGWLLSPMTNNGERELVSSQRYIYGLKRNSA